VLCEKKFLKIIICIFCYIIVINKDSKEFDIFMPILYHYTSINTLLLTLKNMTLRFKSLGYIDDPLEPTISDFGNLGTWKYVTCWSEVPESIPMWNMYADEQMKKLII
jgi:hypothetical protein